MTEPSITTASVGEIPPWVDPDALGRVLDAATAGTLCWTPWQGPHIVDGQEYPDVPIPEQEAADWARDCALLVEDTRYSGGHLCYVPTGLGRAFRAVLRGWV